ncbi:hypothetical protein MICAF_40017 [Microcystis aeruginosa PCC 9807]|uniref:Uncharacterized protein n=1 Tax=Microcystis aeruginosa PCC 9807 TaxID=1160283 RepID=I4H910_MICAE|nr:hypothetical protein MICAF_40017 [Microcystis aeruginosa PCC 9807]
MTDRKALLYCLFFFVGYPKTKNHPPDTRDSQTNLIATGPDAHQADWSERRSAASRVH